MNIKFTYRKEMLVYKFIDKLDNEFYTILTTQISDHVGYQAFADLTNSITAPCRSVLQVEHVIP